MAVYENKNFKLDHVISKLDHDADLWVATHNDGLCGFGETPYKAMTAMWNAVKEAEEMIQNDYSCGTFGYSNYD